MKYRADIDGLRAVAVLSVVFFHYSIGRYFGGGYVGVDIFFVISGYLITSIIYSDITNHKYSVANFYDRRVRRIFPALFFVFFACLIASFFMNFPSEVQNIGKCIASSIFFISNILFYATSSYFDQKMELNPVLHTWSLSVEEQFYVLFPVLVFALRSQSSTRRIVVLAIVATVSFTASVIQVHSEPTAAFYLVQFRAWELLMGSLLALDVLPKLNRRWQIEIISSFGLLLILASIYFYSKNTLFPGFAALAPCVGAVAIIYAGGIHNTVVSKMLGLGPIRFVGLISYSLYLWHWPLLVFTRLYHQPKGAVEKFSLVIVCVLIAAVSWWFIERPFRKSGGRLSVKITLGAAAGLMIAVATLAISLGGISGHYWQLPERVDKILAYEDYDVDKNMRAGTCFLTSQFNSFSLFRTEECLRFSKEKKNVLIFGDSHAAHLWSGFQAVYPQINFLQATASGCLPTIDSSGEKHCTDLNNYIFKDFLRKQQVDAVILSGRWKAVDAHSVESTAQALSQLTKTIIILGPIEEYDQSLPRILARAVAENTDEDEVATNHRRSEQKLTDDVFIQLQLPKDVKYISVYSVMSTPKWRLWSDSGVPVQFDYGHLTKEGAMFLAERIGLGVFDNL
jgi:peptidoglycan/LPS O-acetylase OafA/YrhL